MNVDEAFQRRAQDRRETMIARVARSRQERELLEYERDASLEPFRRAEAIWPLVCELAALKGDDATELRLDRSTAGVERSGRDDDKRRTGDSKPR